MKQLSCKLAVEVERLTNIFCETYVSEYKYRRLRAHIEDSARSVPRNIVEGYSRIGLKDYIEFLSFSRASGEELLKDYQKLANKWQIKLNREYWDNRGNWEISKNFYQIPINPINPTIPINFLISLVSVTNYLLDKQIFALEQKFIQEGGYTENLNRKRREHRSY